MKAFLSRGFGVLVAGMLSLGVGACASRAVAPSVSAAPLVRDGATPEAARGVWRSRGYGVVLSVTEGALALHHETAAGCYPDPGGEGSMLEALVYFEPRASRNELAVLSHPGETRYVFDRLEGLPAACAGTGTSAPRVFDVFAATFSEHYAFFGERGVDWAARVREYRPRVGDATDAATLFGIFTGMLAGLEDPHVELSAEELTFKPGEAATLRRVGAQGERAWLSAYRDGILQTVLQGQGHHVANRRIFWGLIGGDVGYLNVVTMGGFSEDGSLDAELRALNAALDEALPAFQGAKAVIVDVSNNRGGYDAVARALAARFAAERRLAYTKWPHGADVEPQAFHVEPATGSRYTGPVFLLTSDVTVSAGEVFTLAMRALPNVTHVGTRTRGALSDALVKPLPNGWTLSLSNEVYADAKRAYFETRGIPPALPWEVFPEDDLAGGHAKAVLALAERARRGPPESAMPSGP